MTTIFNPLFFILYLATSINLACASQLATTLTIQRISNDKWLVSYDFDQAITGINFGPERGNYRQQSWKILTPNVELKRSGRNELVETQSEAFKHLQIELSAYSGFPQGGYSPMNLFSDGGAAIFLPNFLGVAQLDNMPVAMQVKLRLIKLEGENLIASDSQAERSYVYFGQGAVQSRAYGDVLIDKAIPEWARETLEQVLDRLTSFYPIALAHPLRHKIPVMFAVSPHAGETFSIKGGAVAGQIVFRFSGTSIYEDSEKKRSMLQQLIAHELAHIWQSDITGGGANPKQAWIHEGGAEMLAIAALHEAQIWTEQQAQTWEQMLIKECTQLQNNRKSYRGAYACGFQYLKEQKLPYLSMWKLLIQLADQLGTPYTEEMLQTLQAQKQSH
jgi:hypothetical protein